jgi:hypothetical protein
MGYNEEKDLVHLLGFLLGIKARKSPIVKTVTKTELSNNVRDTRKHFDDERLVASIAIECVFVLFRRSFARTRVLNV